MDGPNLIVQSAQPQQQQHLSGYSNHNTSYLQQVYEQTNPQQQANDNNSASNSGQFEQYDRLTSNTSIDTPQHAAGDNNLGKTSSNFEFEFSEEHRRTTTEQPLDSTDDHHRPTFLLAGQNDEQDGQNRLQAGDCDIHQSMNEDDAFIAFCAASSSVLNNDLNRKYHINKLYQPLNHESSACHRNTDHDHHQQQMEQDDEYMLYQELRFIESSAQEMSNGRERTELSKILDDDDCDDIDGQRNDVDPLDCLNLTNIIDSFGDFGDAPLIDSRNGETDPLMSEACSQESESPIKPDSSGLGNEYSPGCQINSTSEYTHEISSNNQYNSMNTNHQYQDMFSQQHADSCYNAIPHDPFPYDQSDPTRINHFRSNHDHYTPSGQLEADHQDITQEIDSCIKILSDPMPTGQTNTEPEVTHAPLVEVPASIKRCTKASSKRKSSTTDASGEVQSQSSGARKLKKRRSTPAIKKSQSVISANKARDDEQKRDHARKAEQIGELTSRLLNDEDESMVSDNSLRSDGSKRNPIVNHYRRRTANARERIRMREINQAFEKLKKVVPAELIRQAIQESEEMSDQGSGRRKSSPSNGKSSDQQSDSMKLTKITTLKLAVSYIGKLSEILSQCPENPPVKLIPRSEESLNSSENLAKFSQKSREDKKPKAERRSRTKTKKSSRATSEKQAPKGTPKPEDMPVQPSESSYNANQSNDNQSIGNLDQPFRDKQQPVSTSTNQILSPPTQHPSPQTLQTAFISIPNQQKPQYLSAFPSQQPLLISQQMTNGAERQLVTPVTVAILGIPSNNGQATSNSNNPRGLQILSLQNTRHCATPMIQQQPTYNLQFSQPHTQNRTPQQVTLTLDDLNGLSVLRLANPQLQNQSVPIQIKTTSNQFLQSHQQTQIFTASNGLSYAFRPMPSSIQQPNNTNLITSSGGTITTSSNHLQFCNNINNNNLITQNISNNNMSNNITTMINNNTSIDSEHQQTMKVNDRIVCNISQSGQIPNSTATTFTGNISEQQTEGPTISTCGRSGHTQQALESNKVFQISQQPMMSNVQQQNAVFVPNGNLMSISTSTSSNQSFQPQSIPIVNQIGSSLDQDQHRKTNVVYISHMGTTNAQQQQICLVAQAPQGQQEQTRAVSRIPEVTRKHQQAVSSNRGLMTNKATTQNKMDYITHFGVQARSQGENTPSETNISKLVASLATSIQPAAQPKNPSGASKTKTSSDSRKSHQLQQQNQQPQQAVRTYRFHNYDGDMINSHLYGSNNSDRQQANHSQKRTQVMKQLQDSMNKLAEQPAASHRSRQNSLSSICSTVSCSSSSPNSASSTSGSPANHSFVVVKSPKSDSGNRSGSNSSPILIDEIRAG